MLFYFFIANAKDQKYGGEERKKPQQLAITIHNP